MPQMQFMIKPASGSCNMRCSYCFYCDEAANRQVSSYGKMGEETLAALVQKAAKASEGRCSFAFQGGEPTLAGLDFFRHFEELLQANGLQSVPRAIQTNGTTLNEEWAAFFAHHGYLVGLSLDGPKDTHNLHRLLPDGGGSYGRVMKAARLLGQYRVPFNILTVVTGQTARHIQKIYGFFTSQGFWHQQYIPCLDPFGKERGGEPYSLTPGRYAQFLKTLFDAWYRDITEGKPIYIRYFDNILGAVAGIPPESCGLLGQCTPQYVVEADGSVFPCDFYAMDEYLLGNIQRNSFADIEEARNKLQFIQRSQPVDDACKACQWYGVCRGGCRRDRETAAGAPLAKNYYCEAFREFFPYAMPRLVQLARRLRG